eukprot:TRINITY_DN7866_c0_g1_i1.p1 TRINITY_DN7866_c0_g1~~TRINITY_DN7866_c0_g1_i1.p1  ORF type:complete len:281 (-),score=81.43 TRINITY_DN7866_c0_g1_i1:32-853(-)
MASEPHPQLDAYVAWAKKRHAMALRDLEGELQDFRSASLVDESYNKADVSDLFQNLLAILKVTIEKEQTEDFQSSAAFLEQLLLAAQEQNVPIEAGPSATDLYSKTGLLAQPRAKLPELSTPAPQAPTGPSEAEVKLQAENSALNEKLLVVQQQFHTMMQEKTKATDELHALQTAAASAAASEAIIIKQITDEIAALKQQLEKKEEEFAHGQKELNVKLSDTTQFQALKKLLAAKNQQLKDLRARLQKYEQSDTKAQIELADEDEDDDSSEDD